MLNSLLERFAQDELVLGWSDAQRAAIDASIQTLSSRAKCFFEAFDFVGVNIFGSWKRNTILPRKYDPQSDIDIMLVFNRESHYRLNSESVRAKVKRFADYYYSRSEIHFDAPCVKLEMGHIKFDLVPAIKRAWMDGYEIPDGCGGWMDTDPSLLDDKLVNVNKSMDGNVVRRVVRLCKYWNKAKEASGMSSYQLENKVLDCIQWTPVPFGRKQNTYDCFLHVIKCLCNYAPYINGTSLNILESIVDARSCGNYDRQLTWMRHLLPQFV